MRSFTLALLMPLMLLSLRRAEAQPQPAPDSLDEEFELLEEEEKVFAAAKHEQEIGQTPAAITLITKEQIEHSACRDVPCLLSQIQEIDVDRIMPLSISVGARALQGSPGEKMLALVNGREINIEVFGDIPWGFLPIHLEDIERIEIIRGPGSSLYGANAYSGVVAITTKKAQTNSSGFSLELGERDHSNLYLNQQVVLGEWRLYGSGSFETDVFLNQPHMRGREVGRLFFNLARKVADSNLEFEAGLFFPKGWMNPALIISHMDHTQAAYLQASFTSERWRSAVQLDYLSMQLQNDFALDYLGIRLGKFPKFIGAISTTLNAETQATLNPFLDNLLILGGTYRWITYLSQDNIPDQVHQHRLGLFIHDEQPLASSFTLTSGIRLDYNNITPFSFSPRLALVWKAAPQHYLRLGFAQAFRKPSFFFTSFHLSDFEESISGMREFFQKNLGNEHLLNENITVFEMGVQSSLAGNLLTVSSDVFFNLYRNCFRMFSNIVATPWGTPDISKSVIQWRNDGQDIDSIGGSIGLVFNKKLFRISANYTFRYSFYASDPLNVSPVMEGAKGSRVTWEPAHLVNVAGSVSLFEAYRVGVFIRGRSSYDFPKMSSSDLLNPGSYTHFPFSWAINSFASWRIEWREEQWLETGVRFSNLLGPGNFLRRPGQLDREVSFFLRGAL